MFNECRHVKSDGLRCRSESFHCETWTAKSRASETCSPQLSATATVLNCRAAKNGTASPSS